MQVQSLGREDPLEEDMATHSSILAMDRGAWRATAHKVAESQTQHACMPTHTHTYLAAWSCACLAQFFSYSDTCLRLLSSLVDCFFGKKPSFVK